MTDFFSELEQQALAAARRRAGRKLPRVPRFAAPAVAAAVIAVIALLAVRGPTDTTEIRQPAPPGGPALPSATVSVRNGTTTAGLATAVAKKLRDAGYEIGFIGNFRDQERATSIVMYERGAARPARDIAARLGIATLRPFTEARRHRADVVVILGRDLA
jgi:LytR cell envelope-related transcriptional attenuator